jgi:hypothetical protein
MKDLIAKIVSNANGQTKQKKDEKLVYHYSG